MAPKAQTSTARRGRPAKGATAATPLDPPTKRRRVAKASAAGVATVEAPKKRGRPAKTKADEPIAQIDNAIKRGRRSVAAAEEAVADAPVAIKKRPGRPSKAAESVAAAAAAPKKRGGRPPKQDVAAEAPATPRRRGRPALNLNRVVGSSRVAKHTSPRSKPTAARSGPRQHAGPVEKVKQAANPVKKARGRPKKVEVEGKVPAPKKAVGRGCKASAPIPAVPAKKVTARPKTAAPRKRRGYTSFEVADRFAAQVKQFIADLLTEDAANAAAAAGEADDEGEEVEIEVELGPQGATVDSSDNLVEEEAAAELDPELLARDEDAADDLASENDQLYDETELPSGTAVLAEIAGVQDELDVQDAIQNDVPMAEADQAELERQSSASSASVDLHEEVTEVSSMPQADGSNEVNVFYRHVDEHVHEHARAPEPVSLFTGF